MCECIKLCKKFSNFHFNVCKWDKERRCLRSFVFIYYSPHSAADGKYSTQGGFASNNESWRNTKMAERTALAKLHTHTRLVCTQMNIMWIHSEAASRLFETQFVLRRLTTYTNKHAFTTHTNTKRAAKTIFKRCLFSVLQQTLLFLNTQKEEWRISSIVLWISTKKQKTIRIKYF